MKMRFRTVAAVAFLVGSTAAGAGVDHDIRAYTADKLDDFTATVSVVKADQRELGKISRDFGFLYKFREVTVRYKEPNKMRIEGAIEGTKGTFIVNGSVQIVQVAKLRLNDRRDFGKSPGKRKSLMDNGMISPYYLTYANAAFMREGTVDGVPVGVFTMTYKDRVEDSSHHVVYIDPKTKIVRRRDSYSQLGQLQAIYYFRDIREVAPGVFFPTRIEVENTDHVIAGVTAYRNVKVNTGLADSVFK